MGLDFVINHGKAFKVKLKVPFETLEEFIMKLDGTEKGIGIACGKCYDSCNEYIIWCIEFKDEDTQVSRADYESYAEDLFDIAMESRKEGELLYISFDIKTFK